tara:strand:- start:105 stop:743 length:639 start_codon:yes stop_codon:yes gene_type:complete
MILYNFSLAPNGQRVNAFLKEKNISIDSQEINVREGEQFKEPFQSMNPFNCIPFLKLDDGSIISESVSICKYLEEELHPNPSLFGRTPKEKAYIDMWNRRLELDALLPLGHAARNKVAFFADRVLAGTRNDIKQSQDIVERGKQMADLLFKRINPHLEKNKFICGENFSIADITGHSIFVTCERLKFEISENFQNVLKWKSTLEKRECFKNE